MKATGIPTNMGLDHVGIVVPNAQLAADFLIEVFDAEFDWEVKREPRPTAGERGWSKLFGVDEDAYMPHVIMLKCGDHPLTQYVELFEWHVPEQTELKGEGGWHKFSDIANSYISFTVKDIDAVIQHIKEKVIPKWAGTRFIQDPPMNFPLRGEVCTSTFLVSPWGMWIELTCWSQSKEKSQIIKKQLADIPHPLEGKHIKEVPAPAFLIDLDIVDHNITLMSQRFKEKEVAWRAPCKAHRCPDLARYIINKGNVNGIVLLTLEEVEAFAAAGIDDIYFANQVATTEELERLASIAKQLKRLRVAVDDADYIKSLAKAVEKWEITTPIEVLVELNINHNRCGTTVEEAVELAVLVKEIQNSTGSLIFAGITGYEGHTPILPKEDKTRETKISHDILKLAKEAIEARGIKVEVVSAGGSCNYMDCLDIGIINEIQAGGGAICDLLYYEKANLRLHGHRPAALVLSQIISMPHDRSRVIGNAGFKTTGWHPFGGLPQPRDDLGLEVVGLSAEHTRMKPIKDYNKPIDLNRGDKIVLIPGYTDAMGFLHKKIYAIRNDHVEAVWDTVL